MARTLEKIDSDLAKAREKKEAIQNELRELTAERDTLLAKESAAAKLAAMSPAERKELGLPEPQVVANAGAIETKESVQG